MKKIVIAMDSFKGSLSSAEAASFIERGIHEFHPEICVLKVPVADGGEGTVHALIGATGGVVCRVTVSDPLNRPVFADYGVLGNGETAVIEMASASGLTLLDKTEQNPMVTSSYGTGELILSALNRGCRNFLIGIGGSATNDAGTGMLEALGYRFLDKNGKIVSGCGGHLSIIQEIDDSDVHPALSESHFKVACDVDNPFYGLNGAAYVFAKQKGATHEMINELDFGLKCFADLIKRRKGIDLMRIAGSGAAGGMGGAFYSFLNAELISGIDMILDAIDFKKQIAGADLIFTGEGRMDFQTLSGKTPLGVLKRAKLQNIPVVALCGAIYDYEKLNKAGFKAILSIQTEAVSLEKAMIKEYAGNNLKNTVIQIINLIEMKESSCL